MKNRVLSILLTLALLLAVLPAGPVGAAWEPKEYTPSQEMVDMIKTMEGFAEKPYWDNSQYSVGYGTKAKTEEDERRYMEEGISREEAEELLYYHLSTKTATILKFLEKYQLTLTQNQFDALLSFSYNCGAGWTLRDTTLRKAVIEGWTGNDFLFAMGEWCTSAGNINQGLIRRRMREANMYINGVYSMDVPETYSYVLYDGIMGGSTVRIQQFDTAAEAAIHAAADAKGYVFAGWYTEPFGGTKVESLTSAVAGDWLYAHWTAGDHKDAPQCEGAVTGTDVSYNREILAGQVPVFESPVRGTAVVNTLRFGHVVSIEKEFTDAAGVVWAKIKDGGWINLKATEQTDKDASSAVDIVVTADGVNIRSGPGTNYSILGSVNSGKHITVTEVASATGYEWGRMDSGWICLLYTNFSEVIGDSNGAPEEPEIPELPSVPESEYDSVEFPKMGICTGSRVSVHMGPSTGHEIASYLDAGDRIEILEIQKAGDSYWGRISSGWVSMSSVNLEAEADGEPETPETTPEAVPVPENRTGVVRVSDRLRVRQDAGTDATIVDYLYNGDQVTITQQKTVGTTVWGKMDRGWISLDYVTFETETEPTEYVVRVDTLLRIRSDAGTTHAICGYLHNGNVVTISQRKMVGSTMWGQIDRGWISMDYVVASDSASDAGAVKKTVTASCLRIRSDAGLDKSIVGHLYRGDTVKVFESKEADSMVWWRMDSGWISGDYLQ